VNPNEQGEWIKKHIPHRVRAACARLPMKTSLLGVEATIDPEHLTDEGKIYWRFSTDSIWEGRLAATRWLIEFVGIKENNGNRVACGKGRATDVLISDIAGGALLSPSTSGAGCLAKIWKGCSQASSHATNAYNHPQVDETALAEGLSVILDHLQKTIYDMANERLRDYVMERVS
jgi:hypothetical protein